MKIISSEVEIITPHEINGEDIIKHIELCGRVCYKSEDKITETSAKKFIENIIKNGHESVLEHFSITARFVCDRGVSHEIVRHRIASYSQESTRYCNYGKDSFGNEITFIKPSEIDPSEDLWDIWAKGCEDSENAYMKMIASGATPQQARAVLDNSLKTEVIMTANLREWRHFFKMRTSKAAHPDMREVAIKALNKFKSFVPVVFDDIVV